MLTAEDHDDLVARGLQPARVERALALLAAGGRPTRVDRPATVGDGVHRLDEARRDELAAIGRAAAERLSWFIPASGAATRMTAAVVAAHEGSLLSPSEARVVDVVVAAAPSLAMWPELVARGAVAGDRASILRALAGPGGLPGRAKGLVPFHHGPAGPRTPVGAHLVEAAALAGGPVRLHLTVPPEQRADFEAEVARACAAEGVQAEVSLSVQDPATDLPSLDPDGGPTRDAAGRVALRPGGHGALLGNLASWPGDLVLVRNVDNVTPPGGLAEAVVWRAALVGLLVMLQEGARQAVRDGQAEAFAATWLGGGGEAALRRPWRVAGVVRNEGQAGGGPAWAWGPDGLSLQIVEAAQLGPDQADVLRGGTHFNPVDMVLGVAGLDGVTFDLMAFADPDAVLVTEKSQGGRRVRVLEHPGLWNGGMARWSTVFVEIPASLFRPVKTLADLVGG